MTPTEKTEKKFSARHAKSLANVYSIAGDATRLQIIGLLSNRSMVVKEIQEAIDSCTQPNVSHHLARMLAIGVVEVNHEGKFRRYSLTTKGAAILSVAAAIV